MGEFKYSNKNIRATAYEEFWGDEHIAYLYLWEGSKKRKSLVELDREKDHTCIDLFASSEKVDDAMAICKSLYFKYIPILAKRLNEYQNLELSNDFWQIAFGYWLYRHICVVYEKFSCLSKIDIDNTSINLLDKKSFYVPKDHGEYLAFYSNDFGVNQLVSGYYYLFANKEFKTIEKTYKPANPRINDSQKSKVVNWLKKTVIKIRKPNVVLLDTYYSKKHYKVIQLKSKGGILPIELPNSLINENLSADVDMRQHIFKSDTIDPFEKYLMNSFIHGVPTVFIEDFKNHFVPYSKDIDRRNFKHIVSEGWMGRSKIAIYFALANEKKRNIIIQEHASSCSYIDRSFLWFYLSINKKLITTGWRTNNENVIPGSFLAKTPEKYDFDPAKSQILFLGHTVTKYLMEYSWHPANSNFIAEMRNAQQVIDLIPRNLVEFLKFRPRKAITHWNTEEILDLKKLKISIDHGNFHDSINESRIIIIDHMSTGIAELLLIGIPFLILVNGHTQFTKDAEPIMKDLENNGVLHYSPESLVKKLDDVYSNSTEWWKTDSVKNAIDTFKDSFIDTDSNTFNFLTSLLKK